MRLKTSKRFGVLGTVCDVNNSLLWRFRGVVAYPAAFLIGAAWLGVLRRVGTDLATSSYMSNAILGVLCSTLALAFLLHVPEGSWRHRVLREGCNLAGVALLNGLLLGYTIVITPERILQQTEGPTAVGISFVGSNHLTTTFLTLGFGLASAVAVRGFAHLYAFWNRLRQRRLVWEITHVQVRLVAVVMALLLLVCLVVLLFNLRQYATESTRQVVSAMSTVVIVAGILGILTGVSMILILIPASALSFFAARRITRRLDALVEATDRIRQGRTGVRVTVGGEDEVAQLQTAFNAMTEALEQALRDLEAERDSVAALLASRRMLFASISHELRTPVATLRAHLESLPEHTAATPDLRSDMDIMERELLRLQRLIDDVFALARLDVDQLRLDLQPIEVSDVLERIARAVRMQSWKTGKIDVVLDSQSLLPAVLVDETRLEQVLHNLVRNAVRHTLPGGLVVISARAEASHLRIDVKDTGEGIAPENMPHIWERFYQAGRHTRDPDSAGLGLPLVKEMVEAMGGTVVAESTPGVGSVFTIRLPRISRD